jgi:hypothetical protein
MRRRFPELRGRRRFGLISLAIYLIELGIALRLSLKIASPDRLGLVHAALGACRSMPIARSKPPVPPNTSLLFGHNATALLPHRA